MHFNGLNDWNIFSQDKSSDVLETCSSNEKVVVLISNTQVDKHKQKDMKRENAKEYEIEKIHSTSLKFINSYTIL